MNNAFTDDIKSDLWSVMLYDDRNFFTNHLFGESRTEKVIENQWDVMQIKEAASIHTFAYKHTDHEWYKRFKNIVEY